MLDSLRKKHPELARSTLHVWSVRYPRLVSPYLVPLDYYLSPVMQADETVVYIGGVKHVIFSTEVEGARFYTGLQFGRFKGSHGARGMFKMDMEVRGCVPELVRTDGAKNFASAHSAVMRHNDSGTTPFRTSNIHADGDMNTNMKEKHNDTLRDFEITCRELKTPRTAHMAMRQIRFNFARTHTEPGTRPSEAAGVCFGDRDKWRAVIACAADFNADAEARRRKRTSGSDLPRQAGFQVVSRFRY